MTDKHSWLIYGATGELAADVPPGRWLPFADDEAAKASPVYEGYTWAGIADAQGGVLRLTWNSIEGWVAVNEMVTVYAQGGRRSVVASKPEAVKAE